jgi:hypothetical protein
LATFNDEIEVEIDILWYRLPATKEREMSFRPVMLPAIVAMSALTLMQGASARPLSNQADP